MATYGDLSGMRLFGGANALGTPSPPPLPPSYLPAPPAFSSLPAPPQISNVAMAADNAFANSLGKAVNGSMDTGLVGGLKGAGIKNVASGITRGLVPFAASTAVRGLGDKVGGDAGNVINGFGVGGQLGSMGGPMASLVGAAGVGTGNAATATAPGNELVNALRGASDNKLANAVAGTSFLPQISELISKATGQPVERTNDTFTDLLKDGGALSWLPFVGGTQGGGEQQQSQTPQDKMKQLFDTTKLPKQDQDQLQQTYDALKLTGASDDDAWKAVSSAALQTMQSNQQQEKSLAQAAAMQMQVKKYMEPYAEKIQQIGDLQAAALAPLAANLPQNMQGLGQFMASNEPNEAELDSNKLMQQAVALPGQVQQQQYQAQQRAIANQLNQMLQAQQLKQSVQGGQINPNLLQQAQQ